MRDNSQTDIARSVRTALGIGLATSAVALAGCNDDTTLKSGDAAVTVTGQVMTAPANASERSPVADAEVALQVAGDLRTVTTGEEGYFSIEDVPMVAGQGHELTVEKEGYLKTTDSLKLDIEGNDYVANLGAIGLAKGKTVTVNVTHGGSPVGHAAQVVAISEGTAANCSDDFSELGPEWTTATTENGTAEVKLAECAQYDLYVPASGPDGSIEYTTGTFDGSSDGSPYFSIPANGQTVAIGLQKASRDEDLAIIDASVNERLNPDIVKSGDDIRAVFNYPVELQNPRLVIKNYNDPTKTSNAGEVDEVLVDSSNISLDETGTIMTIANANGLPVNESVQISGTATVDMGGGATQELFDLAGDSWLVANDKALAEETITVSAYDSANEPAGGEKVYLQVPDYYEGTYSVASYTVSGGDGTTVNGFDTNLVNDYPGPGDVVWGNSDGVDNGVNAAVVEYPLNDLTGVVTTGDQVTLDLNLEGPDGSYNTSKTFTVK